jgi:hypothetical protein
MDTVWELDRLLWRDLGLVNAPGSSADNAQERDEQDDLRPGLFK